MMKCTECGKEIASGAVVCKHCGASLGRAAKPGAIKIISILCLLSAGFGLSINFLGITPFNHIYKVGRMPLVNENIFLILIDIAGISAAIYCSIGIYMMKNTARKIFIGYSLVKILIIIIAIKTYGLFIWRIGDFITYFSLNGFQFVLFPYISLIILGYVTVKLFKLKDYFG